MIDEVSGKAREPRRNPVRPAPWTVGISVYPHDLADLDGLLTAKLRRYGFVP